MNKVVQRALVLVLVLGMGVFPVAGQPLTPVGKVVGKDDQGLPVYRVQVNGIELGYKLVGEGEPLVMIQGLGGTMALWPRPIIEGLSKKRQLILLDNRGMGFSTVDEAAFSYPLFAKDVIGLLDALGVKRAHVLGYSMGSTITQQLLLSYPERVDKAVVHATTVDGSNVAAVLKARLPDNPVVRRQLEATVPWRTPLERMAGVRNPVLFVVGTADTVVGPQSSITLASTVPGAWLVQFKGATHHLIYEAPERFEKVVETFLDMDQTVVPPVHP